MVAPAAVLSLVGAKNLFPMKWVTSHMFGSVVPNSKQKIYPSMSYHVDRDLRTRGF